jgi:hypothetical protein
MRVFHDDDHKVDYNIYTNILVQKQPTFSVPISAENCRREAPIKTAGKNGYQSKINSI